MIKINDFKSIDLISFCVERLTIALDEESEFIVQKFSQEKNLSKTAVIRLALKSLIMQSKLEKVCPIEHLSIYGLFLTNKDHVILDVEHWDAFFKEIKQGSDIFWKDVFEIGVLAP